MGGDSCCMSFSEAWLSLTNNATRFSDASSQSSSRKWLIKGDDNKTTSNAFSLGQFSYSADKSPEAENDRVSKKRKTCLPNPTTLRRDMCSTADTQDNNLQIPECGNGDKFPSPKWDAFVKEVNLGVSSYNPLLRHRFSSH